jgi:hypothetical protein
LRKISPDDLTDYH